MVQLVGLLLPDRRIMVGGGGEEGTANESVYYIAANRRIS